MTTCRRWHISRRELLRYVLTLVAWVGLCGASFAAQAEEPIGVYLTWKRDPATTMTVNWVDEDADSTTTLWYRRAGTDDWSSAEAKPSKVGPSQMHVRRVELSELVPDTFYQFGIGDKPDGSDDGWRFRTMPESFDREITFVTGGDMMRSRSTVDAMNRQAARLDPDFALLGGDLAYANGRDASRWVDWLESWKVNCVGKDGRLIPMVLAIGNHEVRGGYGGKIPDDAPFFYSLFSLPDDRAYYALDFGSDLSLVVLDSGHTNAIDGDQADWLGAALAERTEQTFLFACYHYPAYGTTKAPRNGLPIDASRSVEIRENWVPHFERYGVTAAFENDHHNFKRSHRLRQHERDDENGILYLGDGAWGVSTRSVPSPEEGWWLAKAEPRNHLWYVTLRPDKTATMQAVDMEGEVFDEVEVARPRTRPVEE